MTWKTRIHFRILDISVLENRSMEIVRSVPFTTNDIILSTSGKFGIRLVSHPTYRVVH